MRPVFHSLEISDIRRETKDCCSIAFDVPAALKEVYQFKQGQYVTLKAQIDGEEVRRSYSICVSPLDGELRVAVKQVPYGLFSTYANTKMQVGDRIDVMNPMGNFNTAIKDDQAKNYLAVAAGSGITPIMSIMKTVLQVEPLSRFTLIYGNKNTKSIIFREQIEALKNQFMDRFDVHYVLSRESLESPLYNGRINSEKINSFSKSVIDFQSMDELFICGPETMIFEVKDIASALGMSDKQIHFELFTSAGSATKKETRIDNGEELDRSISDISIHLDGKSFSFELEKNSENILDAALEQGADLPFACKGGVCCTCKAKLLSGEVDMKINYALEEDEVAAGYILTCQSFPVSEQVEIEFDQY